MNEDAVNAIRRLVWSGFYDRDRIFEIVTEDLFESDEIDEEWVAAQIKDELRRKSNDELTWPTVTDCDRLDNAFVELNEAGVIALQNAGYEPSDGIAEVNEVYDELGGPDSSVAGYCFYHGQDLEGAVDGRGLMLSFGDIDGADEMGLEIGQRIVAVLTGHGLKVRWPATIAKRIEIPHMVWQRKLPSGG
jgi:hypothetical protein